jgi:outer membrane receptor protein involved in Fe transport
LTEKVEIKANAQTKLDMVLVSSDAVEAASRVAESVEDAPASVTLIPSPELRSMHYPTVAEAVRGVRGVYVTDDRGYKTVGFRGFSRPGDYGNRVLILMDGHPTNDNWLWSSYVGYDLRTDIEDVERIEVVRGPGSVLYGTGAFSGVINLVTNTRDLPTGREVGVSVAEEGVARARARVTQKLSDDAGITTSISVGRAAGKDYFVPEYVADGPPQVAGNSRGLDGFNMGTVNGRVYWKFITAQWFANHHNKFLPIGQFDTLFGDGRTRQADTRLFLEAKAEPKIGDAFESLTRVHVNHYAYRAKFAHMPDQGGLERNDYDGSWAGAEQRVAYTPMKELRLTAGGEGQYHFKTRQSSATELDGTLFDESRQFSLVAAYGVVDVKPTEQIKASGAVRVDKYSTLPASINPRAAFILKPWEGGNLKVMGGKAFRAPSLYELFYLAGGQNPNLDLRPENAYTAEVELSQRFSRAVIGTATVYTNYITDLIVLRDLPPNALGAPQYRYENTNVPVGTLGGEIELRREWKEGWMVGIQYSFQKSRYLAGKSIGDLFALDRAPGFREVPNSPSHLASVKGGVPILSRALMLMSRLTLEGPRYDRNDQEIAGIRQEQTPAAVIWDFVFSGTESRWGLHYSVGVYNAFDARWRAPVSTEFRQTTVPQLGRSLMALASVVF